MVRGGPSTDASGVAKPRPLLKTLGANVRASRTEQGLTQEQLADRTGMAAESVSRLEGGRLNISVAKLGGLAEALGIPVADLLKGSAASPTTLRPGERKVLALLDGLDDGALKAVHAGLRHLLSVSMPKRRSRKPTSPRR